MSDPIELTFKLSAEDFSKANEFKRSLKPTKIGPIRRWLLKLGANYFGRKNERSDNNLPTKHAFDKDGVHVFNPNDVRTEPWDYFDEIIEYPDGYLFVKEKQIMLLVPKRTFLDSYQQEKFRGLIKRNLKENAN